MANLAIVQEQRTKGRYRNTDAGNGLAIQELIQRAARELWPDCEDDTYADDPKRFRIIIAERFIEGRNPGYLQAKLGLAKAQYFVKQGQAIDLLAAKLSEWEAQHGQKRNAPYPGTYSPPDVASFVGRQTELGYYSQKIAELNYVVITGFPGVGKTALAAKLVRQIAQPENVFWYPCRHGDSADTLMWALAQFLLEHNHPELWQNLNSAGESEKLATPLAHRIDLAMQILSTNGYLVCLDDFQFIDDEPHVRQLVEQFYAATQTVRLQLVVTSHRIPLFMRQIFQPLTGLSRPDAHTFLRKQNIHLTTAQFEKLYAQIDGHVVMLNLAANILRKENDADRLIEQLAETSEIELFLLDKVDRQLTVEERALMGGVALLGEEGGERDAIETVLDGGSVRQALRQLGRRNLLTTQLSDEGTIYQQHTIVRTFYYDNLGLRERRAMHLRAANYFLDTAKPVQAANHYLAADDVANAVELATSNIRTLLHRGQAGQLRRVLEALARRDLADQERCAIQIALGKLYTFTHQDEEAQRCFRQALSQLMNPRPIEDAHRFRYEAYRGLGYLLRSNQPADALSWLEQGLHELTADEPCWRADLLIQKGIVLRRLKHGDEALSALREGLTSLESAEASAHDQAVERLQLLGWMNLGVSYYLRGELDTSERFLRQALQQAMFLHDDFNRLGVQNNLAVLYELKGRWADAAANYQEVITLATNLGNRRDQIYAQINLGILCSHKGEDAEAAATFSQAITWARQIQKHDQLIMALAFSAEFHLSRGQWDVAVAHLDEAEALSLEIGFESQLPLIYRVRAQSHLAIGEFSNALTEVEKSLANCTKLGMQTETGPGLRVLGQVQSAMECVDDAVQNFAASLEQAVNNAYEEALVRAAWGRHLLQYGVRDEGQKLLIDAQITFERLGAMHDLTEVTSLLKPTAKG
ncbi:MAG: tetratricopeptide repeat protein [Caldilineaceae bacterium]